MNLPASDEEKKPHSLSAFWYSGLPDVAAAAVPILRLLQAEQQLSQLIDELVPLPGVRFVPRDGTALLPYDEALLPAGWRVRVSQLPKCYRLLLNDLHSQAGSTAWPAIDAARAFLKARDQRMIGDHEGDRKNLRRTLYLLDLLPDHRFAAGM